MLKETSFNFSICTKQQYLNFNELGLVINMSTQLYIGNAKTFTRKDKPEWEKAV